MAKPHIVNQYVLEHVLVIEVIPFSENKLPIMWVSILKLNYETPLFNMLVLEDMRYAWSESTNIKYSW